MTTRLQCVSTVSDMSYAYNTDYNIANNDIIIQYRQYISNIRVLHMNPCLVRLRYTHALTTTIDNCSHMTFTIEFGVHCLYNLRYCILRIM
jgi:hypothetical protein